MKKLLFSIAFLCAMFSNGQTIETKSSCDSNTDGNVDITDVTNTADKVLGRAAVEKLVVTAESLNALLSEINSKLDKLEETRQQVEILKKCLSALAAKEGTLTPEDIEAEQAKYNGHDYVDLGLSVKWATMNVGATEVAGSKKNSHTGQLDCYGEYYAWGETSAKDSYNWASYKWMASGKSSWDYCTKYTTADNQTSASWYYNNTYVGTSVDGVIYKEKTVLDPEDDAARANWGGSWRMPTYAEQTELRENCYWEWTTSYNNSGVKGYIVYKVKNDSDKGKKNNTSSSSQSPTASYSLSDTHIFLPASGCHDDSSFQYVGSNGLYWSSSLSTSDSRSAFDLYFDSDGVYLYTHYRCFGFVVRPICP